MKKNLITRVTSLISASAHALVQKVENCAPEVMLEHAIRDMDGVLDELRQELGQTLANKHLASKRLSETNTQYEALSNQIEDALKQGREDLAQAAIAAQLDIEAQLPVLEKAVAEFCDLEKDLEGYISALDAKKRQMHEEIRAFVQAKGQTPAGGIEVQKSNHAFKAKEAISHFDNIMQRHTGLSSPGHDPQSAKKLRELEALSRENRIKERLEALKKTHTGFTEVS